MTESRAVEVVRGATADRAYEILAILRDGEASVKQLSAAMGITTSNASVRMRVLREYGLVSCRLGEGDSRFRVYAATPVALAVLAAVDGLRSMP
jgi:DNA-binding transcriptional ArsR family regulator